MTKNHQSQQKLATTYGVVDRIYKNFMVNGPQKGVASKTIYTQNLRAKSQLSKSSAKK